MTDERTVDLIIQRMQLVKGMLDDPSDCQHIESLTIFDQSHPEVSNQLNVLNYDFCEMIRRYVDAGNIPKVKFLFETLRRCCGALQEGDA